ASKSPDTPSVGRTLRGCGPAAPVTRCDGRVENGIAEYTLPFEEGEALRRVRREHDGEAAAAVGVGRAGARQGEDRGRGEALQALRVERCVGGDDDHARSVRRSVFPLT